MIELIIPERPSGGTDPVAASLRRRSWHRSASDLTDDTWDRRETALGTEAYGAPEAVHIGHPVFFGLTGRAAGPKRQVPPSEAPLNHSYT